MTPAPQSPSPTSDLRCPCCGQHLSFDGAGLWECDICSVAAREGKSVEDVRREVEDLARGFTSRFSTEPCTCGAGSGAVHVRHTASGDRGIVDFEVKHRASCPRGVRRFRWGPIVDEWWPTLVAAQFAPGSQARAAIIDARDQVERTFSPGASPSSEGGAG